MSLSPSPVLLALDHAVPNNRPAFIKCITAGKQLASPAFSEDDEMVLGGAGTQYSESLSVKKVFPFQFSFEPPVIKKNVSV